MTLSVCVQEKSRHFTARTCNCIIIVLDAIKPITHKRLIKANNLHALYLMQSTRSIKSLSRNLRFWTNFLITVL
ncbi:unnamed protein product, partial [Brassica rapa subsp. narinosa]